MTRFRATVWVLTWAAKAAFGDEAITKRIREQEAPDPAAFEAAVRAQYPGDEVWFGPIGEPWGPRA